jgi:anti-sigma factor RsiW
VGFYRRKAAPCERWLRAISLRLDGEASELEVAALDRHLAECPRCSEIAAETAAVTYLLREAPLLELRHPVVVTSPRRARKQFVRRAAAVCVVAAGLAVAAGMTIFQSSGASHPSSALGFRDLNEQRQFVRAELIRLEPAAPAPGGTPHRFTAGALL